MLEFLHLLAELAARRVLVVRGEIADRVVAPVVPQTAFDQQRIVDELVDGEKFDRRDAETLQVLDRGGMRQAGVCSSLILRNVRMSPGEAFDVDLIDDRLVPRCVRVAIASPAEVRIGDDRLRHERRAILVVLRVLRIAEEVAEDGLVPLYLSFHRFAVGIEEKLRWIAALAAFRLPRSVDAISIALARSDIRQIAVPDEADHLRQIDAGLNPTLVEEAQLDTGRHFGEEREIRAGAVMRCAERIRLSGPDFHFDVPRTTLGEAPLTRQAVCHASRSAVRGPRRADGTPLAWPHPA